MSTPLRLGLLACALPLCLLFGALWGGHGYSLDPASAVRAMVGQGDAIAVHVVRDLRLPRVLLSGALGVCLALAGMIAQTVLRNPLADPSLLGVNAGSTCALLVLIQLTPAGSRVASLLRPFVSLGGAVLAAALLLLSLRRSRSRATEPERVVLAGLVLGIALGAATQLLLAYLPEQNYERATHWLSGALALADWQALPYVVAPLLAVPLLWALAPTLDLLALGDGPAIALGLPLARARLGLLVIALFLSANAAVLGGNVVFLGLFAPHLARRWVGPGHRHALLATALLGADLAIVAETLGRTSLRVELPIGVPLGIAGAFLLPFVVRRTARLEAA